MGFLIFLAAVMGAIAIGEAAELNPFFKAALVLLAMILSLGVVLARSSGQRRPKDHDSS